MWNLLGVGLTAIMASLAAVIWIYYGLPADMHPGQIDLRIETAKAALNVVVIVVFGSAAKLLGDSWQKWKARLDEHKELRRKLVSDLVDAYSNVKHARRIMQALGFNFAGDLILDVYDAQLQTISLARLKIDAVIRRA